MTVVAPAASELISWLTGSWTVERAVNGVPGTFIGAAEFVALSDGTLRWHVTGPDRDDEITSQYLRFVTQATAPACFDQKRFPARVS
jgi:hypothetical protein